MAEDPKKNPLFKSKTGNKRKQKKDDMQIIRRVSSRLTERLRIRQNKDDNIQIISDVASHLQERQKIRQSVGTYLKKKPCEQNRNGDHSKKKLNRTKSLRNRVAHVGKIYLKSPKHKELYTGENNCKRLVLLDCKVVVKKLNLKKLQFVKNEMHCTYNHKTENLKLSTENKKLCFDKIISKGLPLLDCKVRLNKLSKNYPKSLKNKNDYVNAKEKEELSKLPSQIEKLPCGNTISKESVDRKPDSDLSKCDANISNSHKLDLPEKNNQHNRPDSDLVTRYITPSTSKAGRKLTEYVSESVSNELTEMKTEQMVLGSKSATIQNIFEPDKTSYLDSNYNNSDYIYASEVKTEIKFKPADSVYQTVVLKNYSSSGLLQELSNKQTSMLSNPVSEKLVSEIKKEPVDKLFDSCNITNKTVCSSPEYFNRGILGNFCVKQELVDNEELDKEFYNSKTIDKPFKNSVSTNLEKNLQKIKSEPNEICFGTQTHPTNCSKPVKIKGAFALRERLHIHTSENQVKQEPLKVDEQKEKANDILCNLGQKGKESKNIYNTKLDATDVTECSNNRGGKSPNKVSDITLSDSIQSGIAVDNGDLSSRKNKNAKICHEDLTPHPQANEVCEDIFPCSIQSGIVVYNTNFHSDYRFVRNKSAYLIPTHGLLHNRKCTLSVMLGSNHIETLVPLGGYVFINGTATRCNWIMYPLRVYVDGIWNRQEDTFTVFVIWKGIKPWINVNIFPMATDYFDVEGKCTTFDNMIKIRVDKGDFTLHCPNIVGSFLNGKKKIFSIPDDTPVTLYIRRYSSPTPYNEPEWAILSMVLYIK